jgi:transposase InsO family protein
MRRGFNTLTVQAEKVLMKDPYSGHPPLDATGGDDADLPEAQYQQGGEGHKIYLLMRGLQVDRPNQVWCADITYLHPLGRLLCNRLPSSGCAATSLLGAIMDSGTRVKFWPGVSRTLEADFRVDTLTRLFTASVYPES